MASLSPAVLEETLARVMKILRKRFVEATLDRVVLKKTRAEIYMTITGRRVKVVFRVKSKSSGEDVDVRVFSGLTGLDISLKRLFKREYLSAWRQLKRGEESV